jgi:hypothetical protein
MKYTSLILIAMTMFGSCSDPEETISQSAQTKLRGIKTNGSNWNANEVYEYHLDGRIKEIQWERNTPYTTQGVEKYVYDNNLRLSGMIREMTGLVAEEIRYDYVGRIVEASSYFNGVKESNTIYYYNPADQLVKSEQYRRDPLANKFNLEGEIQYTYHSHGNVYEIKQFVFDSQQSQMKLHTTRTYPEYLLDRIAVLDSHPSLPTVRLQKNIPKKYVLTTPSSQIEIFYSYRWMPDGKLLDRMTYLPDGSSEQTVYTFHE